MAQPGRRGLQTGLRVLAGVLLLVAAGVVASPFIWAHAFRELPFVHATVALPLLLGLLALWSAGSASPSVGSWPGDRHPAVRLAPAEGTLTKPERRARLVLVVLGALFAGDAAASVVGALLNGTHDAFARWPFVLCTVLGAAAIAVLCGWIALDLRGRLQWVGPLIGVYAVKPFVGLAFLAFADTDRTLPIFGAHVSVVPVQWGWVIVDVAIIVVLPLASRAAWRARYGLGFLGANEYRALIALADVLVAGPDEGVPAQDVAANVETYMRSVRAHRVWVYRVALLAAQLRPLLSGWPVLSQLEPVTRRAFLERHFLFPPSWPPLLKHLTQVVIRVGQQLVFSGYYNDRRTWPAIGYVPFSERGRPATRSPPLKLKVTPAAEVGERLEADVVIVGSGAGGSILAYELAKAGRDVLVLERGSYVQPHEFSENEVDMFGRLYRDGIMQQTADFRFTVLQGECVGGSTTVNNAVCFRPPEHVLDRWNDPRLHDAGLDRGALNASLDAVEAFLRVQPQDRAVPNRSATEYLAGARASGMSPDALAAGVVRANIDGCVGCGYCNIGCAYGHKLSMLDVTLPRAQADFGAGRVRIVADCEVEKLLGRGGRVSGVRARLDGGRAVKVSANDVVVSAGAVGSSYLLLRSGIGRRLPVGRGLCFNMGAPLTADFGRKLDAYDGLQISHAGVPRIDAGYVFELWFNPPVAQALNMPGWFEQHFENMLRYDQMMAVGVLVGTEGNARVRRALTGGADIDYVPTQGDLRTLSRGLQTLGSLLFAAGAERVMLNTWGYDEFRSPDELGRIDALAADPDYISLGTGHPQGGNALSQDPRRGVIGPDFRVHGYDNLAVVDASVFPSSLTVNPQLTTMGLAHYAAQRLA
jgi:choline dehydrogenase-like flavoprotein